MAEATAAELEAVAAEMAGDVVVAGAGAEAEEVASPADTDESASE